MMLMNLSLNKSLLAATGVIVLTLASVLFVSIRQSGELKKTSVSVTENQDILLHLQKLGFAVLDNETAARGYVITGKAAFLLPIRGSENDAAAEQKALETLVTDKATLRLLRDSIGAYLAKRFEFSARMARVYKDSGAAAAADLVSMGLGKSYTNRIRSIINEITAQVNDHLAVVKKGNEKTINSLNFLLYAVLLASFVLSAIIVQKIGSETNRQRVNEQKFSALLDAAPDATVIVDDRGTIQMVNQQAQNLFGYTREEIVGKPVEILIPEEQRSRHTGHRNQFMAEARVRPMGAGIELRAVRKDGSSFPVEISLSPINTTSGLMVSASVRDITNRKKAEEKFRSLLDSAPDATVIVNEEGAIQMVNHQAEMLFGYGREEMIGRPVEILVPVELRNKHAMHRANFAAAPRVRAMGLGIELNAIRKDGSRFPVEISLSPIDTEDGLLISASVRDISLRKELENELRKSNAEMEAFTYSVSHDLRAPLRGIIGFTTILEEDYANRLDDEARRITGVIKGNTMRMGHLIDDLLAFSRMGKQELIKTQVNSKALVNEVITDLLQEQLVKKQVKWNIGELPPVNADLHTIRQVWINLISNAIKYSGRADQPAIEIASYFENGQTVFYVKDNGVGFDEKYVDKLFKVFQRLHGAEEFEGTGVGLALVEKIVSRHQGKVWAEGKEGKGASFYFSLPIQ
jgi:PAS domain S-box-containing protein